MSQEGVRKVVGRMISDPGFAKTFHQNPQGAIASAGYAVDAHELAALQKIKPNDFHLNVVHGGPGAAGFSIETFTSVKTA